MEKLELKHLAPYFPYGLNFIFNLNDVHEEYKKENRIKMLTCDSINLCIMIGKPTLRPLSDLTKEIEHNGERFVPSKALSCWDLDGISLIDIPHIPVNLYELFLKWHFDVFGLIDKGLAIDINTI